MPWEKQFETEVFLEKAMRAFWEHGYESTSMQDIVDYTGVNRGSIYSTFGDKHAVFVAALLLYDKTIRETVLKDLREFHDPVEAIRQLFMVFARPAHSIVGRRGCLMTNSALELAPHDKAVAKIVAAAQGNILEFLTRRVRDGMKLGMITNTTAAKTIAASLLASLLGLMVLNRSGANGNILMLAAESSLAMLK